VREREREREREYREYETTLETEKDESCNFLHTGNSGCQLYSANRLCRSEMENTTPLCTPLLSGPHTSSSTSPLSQEDRSKEIQLLYNTASQYKLTTSCGPQPKCSYSTFEGKWALNNGSVTSFTL
jgi:hypothetical protein